MITAFKEKFIGDKRFYRRVLLMVIPMIMQMLVTNFVSLIDNIMVGRIGTEQMSGVSIANQFVFIFNITVFGAVSGPGIFGAQFFGKGDNEGQKYTFRFRLLICALIIGAVCVIYGLFDDELISLYLSKNDPPETAAATLAYGKSYMRIMLVGFIPFGIGQAYTSVLSECGHTKIPMAGAMSAVGINVLLDYCLIFGKLGFPELGVEGAAIATVISKFIEALVKIIWTHTHKEKNKYVIGLFKGFRIPSKLTADMIRRGIPLLLNEFLWAAGMSVIAQCYSVRGLSVVAARNISGTVTNLFGAVYIQLGACIAIIVGAKLGANKTDEARDLDNKMLFFSVSAASAVALLMIPLAKFFPMLYNTDNEIRALAGYMIVIQAAAMPIWSFTNACYFTLRCGGKTGLTFLFDFGFTWLLMIPLAFFLAYFTKLNIHIVFAAVTFSELIKVIIGYFMIKSDIWINNIVNDTDVLIGNSE
ncbi:MAG: MATE family efflux transporter [Ruminococcus sp.]|nr:MATE family efflux transporter [Ruminococcus sp.]